MGYSVVNIEDIEGAGPCRRRQVRAARARRRSIRCQLVRAGPERRGPSSTTKQDSQQEEVNVVIDGAGRWRIDGEEIDVKRGTVLRFDPETTRCPIAGPDGMTFIGIGARRGSYEARGPF